MPTWGCSKAFIGAEDLSVRVQPGVESQGAQSGQPFVPLLVRIIINEGPRTNREVCADRGQYVDLRTTLEGGLGLQPGQPDWHPTGDRSRFHSASIFESRVSECNGLDEVRISVPIEHAPIRRSISMKVCAFMSNMC